MMRTQFFSVAFESNGKHIIGCGNDTIKVWDALTDHTEVTHMRGHYKGINSLAFSSNCKYIVSGSYDATLRVWDALTGLSVMGPLISHENKVTSVAFSSDGRYVASGYSDCTVRVWDALTGQSVTDTLKGDNHGVTSVVLSPGSKHITSGSWDKTVRVCWNLSHVSLDLFSFIFSRWQVHHQWVWRWNNQSVGGSDRSKCNESSYRS
jgi:WD40 repeat protein